MKWLLVAVSVLWPISASASDAFVCLFKPLKLRFNLLMKNGQDMIQWESAGFQAVVVEFENPMMVIKHYAPSATFKAVVDVSKMQGYGEINTFAGEKSGGEIICALD